MTQSLRTEMPSTAAFIDAMRDAFGAESINQSIKAGMNGQPTFYASENGHEVGTKAQISADKVVGGDDLCIWDEKPKNGLKNAKRGTR